MCVAIYFYSVDTPTKSPSTSPVKKVKVHSISSETKTLIDTDSDNKKIWKELVDDNTLNYQVSQLTFFLFDSFVSYSGLDSGLQRKF